MPIPISIIVNGEPKEASQGETILGLLQHLGIDPERVAVELDRRIVKQSKWGETALSPGAQLEIVQFVGGG